MSDDHGKVLGLGEVFEFEGVAYTVTPFGYTLFGEFSKWCKARAWQEALDTKPFLKPAEWEEMKRETRAMIARGEFNAGEAGYEHWRQTVEGQVYISWLMLRPRHPDITLELVDRMYASAWGEALAEAIAEANRDPNRQKMKAASQAGASSLSSPPAPSSTASPGS